MNVDRCAAKDGTGAAESRDDLRGAELPAVAEHGADGAQTALPGKPSTRYAVHQVPRTLGIQSARYYI